MHNQAGHIAEWWAALLAPEKGARVISDESRIGRFDLFVFLTICAMYCGYGVSMGMPRGVFPALISGFKLPFLYILTLMICFPAFYVLNNLLGPRLSRRACLRLLLLATSANAVAIFSYAPVSYFFTFTTSSEAMSGYRFLVVMHVVVLAIAGAVSFLIIRALFAQTAGQSHRQLRPLFLIGIGAIYAFVGTQMSWVLRPWIGSWAIDYQPFRPIEGSFIEALLRLSGIMS